MDRFLILLIIFIVVDFINGVITTDYSKAIPVSSQSALSRANSIRVSSASALGRANFEGISNPSALSRASSVRTRRLSSAFEAQISEQQEAHDKQVIASYVSSSPSLLFDTPAPASVSVEYEELAKNLLAELVTNLSKIHDNLPSSPNFVVKFCKQIFSSPSAKSLEKKQKEKLAKLRKNPEREKEYINQKLDDLTMSTMDSSPCDELLPPAMVSNRSTKSAEDHAMRQKVRRLLDQLTSWTAVKKAICNSMTNPIYLARCKGIDEEMNLLGDDYEVDSSPTLLISPVKQQKEEARKKGITRLIGKKTMEKKNQQNHTEKMLKNYQRDMPIEFKREFDQARRSLSQVERGSLLKTNSNSSGNESNLKMPNLARSKTTSKSSSNSILTAGGSGLERSFSQRVTKTAAASGSNTKPTKRTSALKKEGNKESRKEPHRVLFDLPEDDQKTDYDSMSGLLPLKPPPAAVSKALLLTRALERAESNAIGQNEIEKGRHSMDFSSPAAARIDYLRRSASLRASSSKAQQLSRVATLFETPIDEYDVKKGILTTIQCQTIQHGLTLMRHDERKKEKIFEQFYRLNYALQLVILQKGLIKLNDHKTASNLKTNFPPYRCTKPFWFIIEKNAKTPTFLSGNFGHELRFLQPTGAQFNVRQEKIDRHDNNLKIYKEMFKKEKDSLINELYKLSKEPFAVEIDDALKILRDSLLAHWSWLYQRLTETLM